MNILIINQPPFNRGDESAHKGLMRAILDKMSNCQIKVLSECRMRESVRQFNVHDKRVKYIFNPTHILGFNLCKKIGLKYNLKLFWFLHPTFAKYKSIYKWADLVLCAPGGICMGGFQDWEHLFLLNLAKFYGKPLVYYGRSFGPFPIVTKDNRLFKRESLKMLRYFSFLSIRERKSEELAESLNIPFISTTDSAFLDNPKVEIPYELKYVLGNKKYMVFVPNYLLWHYAYRGKINHDTVLHFYCEIIDKVWLKNPSLNIVMLPQTFCMDDYSDNDLALFRDIANIKNDTRIIVAADCYSSDIQQTIISDAEFVIGGRYHSVVFAINQAVPVIALSYEHKMAGLMQTVGLNDYYIDFREVLVSKDNRERCLNQIGVILEKLKPTFEAQKKAKSKALSCFKMFVDKFYL